MALARGTWIGFTAAALLMAGIALALLGCAHDAGDAPDASDGAAVSAPETVRVGALKGPTGMGLAPLIQAALPESEQQGAYAFELAGSADGLVPSLVQGDVDIAMLPVATAAILNQKTEGALQVIAINTLGVLDIVCADETVQSMTDLRGRTIVSAGKGSTPEYVLRYLLEQSGIDPDADVNLVWKSEHAECLAALEADPSAVALLPQPFATSALAKIDGARIALDLNDVWDEAARASGSDAMLVTGVAVARTQFINDHPEAVEAFLSDYGRSVDFVNGDASAAAQAIGEAGIIDASVAEKALPYCNIVCVTGADMTAALKEYLQVLFDADPSSVAGALPGDTFYYEAPATS